MHITEVGLNLFQFKFQSEFDMSKVLSGALCRLIIIFFCSKGGRKG